MKKGRLKTEFSGFQTTFHCPIPSKNSIVDGNCNDTALPTPLCTICTVCVAALSHFYFNPL